VSSYRLAKWYLGLLLSAILTFTLLYSYGMSTLEGRPRPFLRSLEVVMQTFTTVGYGQDAPWQHPLMQMLVVSMQMASLLLIFSAFPAVIVPLIEDSLATAPPATRGDLSDHVVVCNATAHTESLIDELVGRDVPYVFVEEDRDVATDLFEQDHAVVHGDPKSIETLEGVNLDSARAVVSDADDMEDMNIITSVKEVTTDVPIYSIATDEDMAAYHELAGADQTFLPRKLLGNGIANKVRNTVHTQIEGVATVGEHFEIAEIPIGSGSELDGKRLTETGIQAPGASSDGRRDRTVTNIIGVWSRGHFYVPPFETVPLDDQTVLLTAGRRAALRSLKKSARSSLNTYGRGRVIVAGAGVVGSIVSDAVVRDDIDQTVIDTEDKPTVDITGDVTDEEVLERANVSGARTVVLALDDDTTTLVAAFVVRNLAPDVEIVARANESESVAKLYRAGVDYVLALSTVAGRLLAQAILESDESVDLDRQIRLVRQSPGALGGQTLEEAAIRERTGCTVIAVERRDGRVSADLSDWTEIGQNDHLLVAGTNAALDRLSALADVGGDT